MIGCQERYVFKLQENFWVLPQRNQQKEIRSYTPVPQWSLEGPKELVVRRHTGQPYRFAF